MRPRPDGRFQAGRGRPSRPLSRQAPTRPASPGIARRAVPAARQTETLGQPAFRRGLQRQRHDDRERDGHDDEVGVLHALGHDDPGERGRHDAGLARPAEEDDLLACPAAAPVGQQAGENRQRAGDEEQRGDDGERRRPLVGDGVERQVRAERDEDEDDHDVGDVRHERAHVSLVARVHAEPEHVHVADDQAGDERAEVAAAAGRVD